MRLSLSSLADPLFRDFLACVSPASRVQEITSRCCAALLDLAEGLQQGYPSSSSGDLVEKGSGLWESANPGDKYCFSEIQGIKVEKMQPHTRVSDLLDRVVQARGEVWVVPSATSMKVFWRTVGRAVWRADSKSSVSGQ